MTCDDTMASIDLDDLLRVDTVTVSDSGRIYLGKDLAGKEVRIVVQELEE